MRRLVLAAIALGLLAGCMRLTPGACASKPEPPLEMDVILQDPCELRDNGARLVLFARASSDVPSFSWGVHLASSLSATPDPLEETRDLAAGTNATLVVPLYPAREGPHLVRAWADAPALRGLGYSMARSFSFRIVEPEGEAPRLEPAPSETPTIGVRIDGEADNATRLVATFASSWRVDAVALVYFSWSPAPPEVAQTDLGWYDGIEDHPEWEGERAPLPGYGTYLAWKGTLEPGEPLVLHYHAPMPPVEGEWTISAHLLPDPRVDTGVHSDEAGFLVEGGRATILRNR